MSREIEKIAGIPVVQMATIVPIMMTVGANRIIPGVAIPHPIGAPDLGPEGDRKIRTKLIKKALEALTTEVSEQTVFKS